MMWASPRLGLATDRIPSPCGSESIRATRCRATRARATGVTRGEVRIFHVVGTRTVDPNWENRPRGVWQQLELRVQRLNSRFDDKLKSLFEGAVDSGK